MFNRFVLVPTSNRLHLRYTWSHCEPPTIVCSEFDAAPVCTSPPPPPCTVHSDQGCIRLHRKQPQICGWCGLVCKQSNRSIRNRLQISTANSGNSLLMVQSVSGGCKLNPKFAVQSNTPQQKSLFEGHHHPRLQPVIPGQPDRFTRVKQHQRSRLMDIRGWNQF